MPDRQELDATAFARAVSSIHHRDTDALLIVRNDRIIHEWYAPESGPDSRLNTSSVQKAVAGALGLALLLQDGSVSLDDRASRFIPAWSNDTVRSRITLRQLGTHSSGLEDAEEGGRPHDELEGWKGEFWNWEPGSSAPIDASLNEAPLLFEPGQAYEYSSSGFGALSYALAAALERSGRPDLRTSLRDRVFRPIGLDESEWEMGYGRAFEVGDLDVWGTWGGGRFTARALARIGRLLLRRGEWEGRRLLSSAAIEDVVRYGGTPVPTPEDPGASPAPAVGFLTNEFGAWPSLPRNAFAAAGASHRLLIVVPALDLIIVRLGDWMADPSEVSFWEAVNRFLIDPLMEAFPEPPVPWSEALAGAWFEPVSSIECAAEGSDNWPITWGADGALYAAYGDGWGFRPRTDEKLSLGFARIAGGPRDLRGTNIRSQTGERTGDGPEGGKASGLLDVSGVLYMWVRNLDNARLAWSEDHGRTWEWGFRFAESFGSPTFLQFGPGYLGARDDRVYVYSQDGPSAYASDDQLILARVHRDSVRSREAYEFFAGLDASGAPQWSRALADRAAVFRNPGGVRRTEAVYNAWMDRYLLAVGYDGSTLELMGTGTEGAWGIFEAPEPWGPWATVYTTPRWDIADTHSYRFPTKWMEDGGLSVHMVFSGREYDGRNYDAFCVRGLRLLPAPRYVPGTEPGS